MGCGPSGPQDKDQLKQSKKIDTDLRGDKDQKKNEHKLLLLGSGESGKSTFFKQLKFLCQIFGDEEKQLWTQFVRSDCIVCMQALVKAAMRLKLDLEEANLEAASILSKAPEGQWTVENAALVKQLWQDKTIQNVFTQRDSAFQLNDSAEYLFESIDRLMRDDFVANRDDIIRTRIRTTGIEEAQLTFNNWSFKMIDVGGQRGERRKWIHCFDNVTAVIYCVSLSEYNQKLREAEEVNRMMESLNLFAGTTNSPWFWNTAIILFFNKVDVFQEKIKIIPLSTCFPNYTGPNDFESTSEFIKERFLQQNKAPHKIYTHLTTAIDPENVSFVFAAVKDTILEISLARSNLI
eukprot:TRINITY_DN15_c0_g1_i1.p2 TRINITY_DN15_c0_g1~~TRINITY_DN15_c0_g1_i1.p2  ORF type:complete len:349 (-),score=64.37 TRINITY_DN15_c0_g1_i1:152-1198(-)